MWQIFDLPVVIDMLSVLEAMTAACLSGNVYTRLIESYDAEKTKQISPQESSSTSEKPKPNCVVKWC